MRWEGRSELRRNGDAIGLDEGEVFAAGAEFEIGVQRCPGQAAVLPRGEHDQGRPRGEIGGREPPFRQVARGVRERPAIEIDGRGAAVLDFNPVFECAILVRQRARVAGHELGNDDRAGGGDCFERADQPAEHDGRNEPSECFHVIDGPYQKIPAIGNENERSSARTPAGRQSRFRNAFQFSRGSLGNCALIVSKRSMNVSRWSSGGAN